MVGRKLIEEDHKSNMKRIGNIYQKIIDIQNLQEADRRAQLGKKRQKGVIEHNKTKERNILALHRSLVTKTYRTSGYHHFIRQEGKRREISSLPYYPDRIVHHAIVLQIEEILADSFIAQTYSCIKKRGVHKCLRDLNSALKEEKYTYCLKLDIKKFYPSVNQQLLKEKLRTKFKDKDLLGLLDEIIDSHNLGGGGGYL